MSQPNTRLTDTERAREMAQARADLLKRAATQGIKPFSFDEWLAEGEAEQSQEEIRREVDEFLRLVREVRDRTSNREPD